MESIRPALEEAAAYLTAHPDEATYTDGAAVARLGEGVLGLDPAIPAGPLRSRVRVSVSGDAAREQLGAIVHWGIEHCPVCDAVKRAVPVDVEVEIA